MTKNEAKEFLEWYSKERENSHYLARYTTYSPVWIAEASLKAEKARVVLGISKWQRPYKEILKMHPELTKEQYMEYRKKHNIDESNDGN